MGLFSGSFGTGLVKGLATSVDKSLRDAMDKRTEEMSRARQFWQTRQAQKLDLKEAHDRRAEKALDRMIREAGGDVALGLAAYQAAGNDPDSVEAYIKKIDLVRDSKGTFNLKDNLLGLEGYEPGKMDITREAALGSVGMQLKGVDASSIAIDDPLSEIGLGLKGGASQRVADKINGLIPPSEVTQVEGLTGVSLDMSKMMAAEEWARATAQYEKAMAPSNYDEALFDINNKLNSLKREDFDSDEAFQTERNNLNGQKASILSDIGSIAAAEAAAGNIGVSDSIMRVIWTDTREQERKRNGIGGKGVDRYFTDANGDMVLAINDQQGFARAIEASDAKAADLFVKTQRREDGSFNSSATNIIGTDIHLKNAYSSLTGESTEPTEEGETAEKPAAGSAQSYSTAEGIAADTQGFATFVTGNIKDLDAAIDAAMGDKPSGPLKLLHDDLIAAGKTEQEANDIITGVVVAERDKRAEAASKPSGFKLGDELSPVKTSTTTPIGEDGKKTVGDVSWSPTSPPSMFSKLSDKSIPENVRMEILEDYVALMLEQGNESQAERARAAAGFGTE